MSTYKLTNRSEFRRALAQRRLFNWEPPDKSVSQVRILACSADVFKQLNDSWGNADDKNEVLRQSVVATCAAFVGGSTPSRLLFKNIGGRKAIAEMQILAPNPGVRIVGGFLDEDVFVALALYLRSEIAWKRGAFSNASRLLEWKQVIELASHDWEAYLPDANRMISLSLSKTTRRQ